MSAAVEYKIIPASVEEVPKEVARKAAIWFNVTMNGVSVPVPRNLRATHGSYTVGFGSDNSLGFSSAALFFPCFGWTEIDPTIWEARREAIRICLTDIAMQIQRINEPPAQVTDLFSDKTVEKTLAVFQPEIHYREPGTVTVTEPRNVPASIYFTCLAAVPSGDQKPVYGKSEDCALTIGCHAASAPDGFLTLKHFGRTSAPLTVQKFSEKQIYEALADLAKNLLAQPKPDGLVTLAPKLATTLQPI